MKELERLETALGAMVKIVRTRADGRRYVPIVRRLEQEISARRGLDEEYERILGLDTYGTR